MHYSSIDFRFYEGIRCCQPWRLLCLQMKFWRVYLEFGIVANSALMSKRPQFVDAMWASRSLRAQKRETVYRRCLTRHLYSVCDSSGPHY